MPELMISSELLTRNASFSSILSRYTALQIT